LTWFPPQHQTNARRKKHREAHATQVALAKRYEQQEEEKKERAKKEKEDEKEKKRKEKKQPSGMSSRTLEAKLG
jgi:hypothetical protein